MNFAEFWKIMMNFAESWIDEFRLIFMDFEGEMFQMNFLKAIRP